MSNPAIFNKEVICFYNEYYASPAVTQKRRQLRNYYNNNVTIRQWNRNPFINNNGKKYGFVNGQAETYMTVAEGGYISIYLLINGCWCFHKKVACAGAF